MTVLVWLFRPFRIAVALTLGGAALPSYSADVMVRTVDEIRIDANFRGEIVRGDFAKIVKLLRVKPTARE